MLVVAGVVRIDAAERDEAIEAIAEVMQDARNAPGCISFVFSIDIEDSTLLHVFEEWESREALHDFVRAPRVEALRIRVGNRGIREVSLERYEITSVGPIV